jgi:hypothetical protein
MGRTRSDFPKADLSDVRLGSTMVGLPEAKNDSLALVKGATRGVWTCSRDGYRYSRAGMIPSISPRRSPKWPFVAPKSR